MSRIAVPRMESRRLLNIPVGGASQHISEQFEKDDLSWHIEVIEREVFTSPKQQSHYCSLRWDEGHWFFWRTLNMLVCFWGIEIHNIFGSPVQIDLRSCRWVLNIDLDISLILIWRFRHLNSNILILSLIYTLSLSFPQRHPSSVHLLHFEFCNQIWIIFTMLSQVLGLLKFHSFFLLIILSLWLEFLVISYFPHSIISNT